MNLDPGFFTRSIYHITYSLLEKYGYEKIIATLLNMPTIELMTPKFLRYGEPRKWQVITLINLYDTSKRARLKQTCCAHMYTFLRAESESSFIWYTFCFATIYLTRYMFILNWDFDVLPINLDENFMLCSLAESMKYD